MRVYHSSLLRNCSFSQNVQIHTHTRLTHARARLPTAMLIFCCHKCHTLLHFSSLFLTSLRTFFPSFLPFRHCPTNDTLFSTKRHVVFHQTTRCFLYNDTLFFIKHHVVFPQTSRLSPFYLNPYRAYL